MNPRTLRALAQLQRPRAAHRQHDERVEGRSWYRMQAAAEEDDVTAIYVYDMIGGWGIYAADFVRDLSSVRSSRIDLHVNSPGGDVFDGIAIMAALAAHPATVTTHVDSLAASIASVIAMAGDRVVMGRHAELMIHDASTLAIGNAAYMRETADLLDRISDNIAGVYAERGGGKVASWRKRMRAETWYSAAEAVEARLADEVAASPVTRTPGAPDEDDEQMAASSRRWIRATYRYGGRLSAPAPDDVDDEPVVDDSETPAPAPAEVPPAPVPEQGEDGGLTAEDRNQLRDALARALNRKAAPCPHRS